MTDAQNWDLENKINNFINHYGDIKISFLKEQLKYLIKSEPIEIKQYSWESKDFTYQTPPECVNPFLNAQFSHMTSVVSDWAKNNKYAHLIKGVTVLPNGDRHIICANTEIEQINFELDESICELDMKLAKDESIVDFEFECVVGYKDISAESWKFLLNQ